MKFYAYVVLLFTVCQGNADFAGTHIESWKGCDFPEGFSSSKLGQSDDEYLDWRSMRIYGELPLVTSKVSLIHFIGSADSTAVADDVCVSFYDESFEHGYFEGIHAEMYGDTVVITSLNFKESHKLFTKSDRIILNHKTTLNDLEKLFPTAVKNRREVDVFRLGNVMTIQLRTGPDPSDDRWLLFFRAGNLIRMDFWMPC